MDEVGLHDYVRESNAIEDLPSDQYGPGSTEFGADAGAVSTRYGRSFDSRGSGTWRGQRRTQGRALRVDDRPSGRGYPIWSVAVAMLAITLGACAPTLEGSSPGAWPEVPVVHEFGPDFGARPPGPLIRLDSGRLSDDGSTITVTFLSGKPFDPANPCAREDISAWVGTLVGGGLGIAVHSFTAPGAATFPPEEPGGVVNACTAEGWTHEARLHLASPYAGRTIQDLGADDILWIDRPEHYIVPGDLPEGWVFERDFSMGWETPAVWTSVFAAPDVNPDFGWGDPGHLVLRQGLDGPPATGLEDVVPAERVTVAGRAGSLRRDPESGQLELAWTLDDVPLLLTGYEQDFTREAFLAVAATLRRDEPRPVASPSGNAGPAISSRKIP